MQEDNCIKKSNTSSDDRCYLTLRSDIILLTEIRNRLFSFSTINEIVNYGIQIIHEKLKTQTVSVFLFTKEGLLTRRELVGMDKNGEKISNDWFADEKYEVGESVTGKAVIPQPNSNFGVPQWSNHLESQAQRAVYRDKYISLLGSLKCVISVPLNGAYSTIGVLEVVNKLDTDCKIIKKCCFSKDNVYWLSIIGTDIATAIVNIWKNEDQKMLTDISKNFVDSLNNNFKLKEDISFIADKLVTEYTRYKVCIIQVVNENSNRETTTKKGNDVSWEKLCYTPINYEEDLAGEVFKTNRMRSINIKGNKHMFKNIEWIESNNLESCICYPIANKERVFGVMFLFLCYPYNFNKYDTSFLGNISFLVASITESYWIKKKLLLTKENEDRQREFLFGKGKGAIVDQQSLRHMHTFSNEILRIIADLKQLKNCSGRKHDELLDRMIKQAVEKIAIVKQSFSEQKKSYNKLNINDVIRQLVSFFKNEHKNSRINFVQECDDNIPIINIDESQIREVIYNLISNAIRAIKTHGKKGGEIVVSSCTMAKKGIQYIHVGVRDNGIGIKNEDVDYIFDRGFSSFENGTGQGLFIAKDIVESYGGRIYFSSSVGKGTTMNFQIPTKRYIF